MQCAFLSVAIRIRRFSTGVIYRFTIQLESFKFDYSSGGAVLECRALLFARCSRRTETNAALSVIISMRLDPRHIQSPGRRSERGALRYRLPTFSRNQSTGTGLYVQPHYRARHYPKPQRHCRAHPSNPPRTLIRTVVPHIERYVSFSSGMPCRFRV